MNNPQLLLKVDSALATELEGYLSIRSDLHYVMRVTFTAIEFLESNQEEDDFTLATYLNASLVAYARPFNDGVRGLKSLKLKSSDIYKDFDGAIDLHEYLMNQRSKLVAHSVNPYEDVGVGIVLNEKGRPISVGFLTSRLVSFTVNDYKQFNQLSKVALEAVNKKISELDKLLFKEVSGYSDEQLSLLKPVEYTAPNPNEARKSKRKSK